MGLRVTDNDYQDGGRKGVNEAVQAALDSLTELGCDSVLILATLPDAGEITRFIREGAGNAFAARECARMFILQEEQQARFAVQSICAAEFEDEDDDD